MCSCPRAPASPGRTGSPQQAGGARHIKAQNEKEIEETWQATRPKDLQKVAPRAAKYKIEVFSPPRTSVIDGNASTSPSLQDREHHLNVHGLRPIQNNTNTREAITELCYITTACKALKAGACCCPATSACAHSNHLLSSKENTTSDMNVTGIRI